MKRAERERLKEGRHARLDTLVWFYKGDLAARLEATRKLFGEKSLAVDIHMHSNYSDGRGTVYENYERAQHAGLDFVFATDHGTIRQKSVVARWKDASWGQEPGAGLHHLGLLCGKRALSPRRDSIAADHERAKKLAPFVWIPHPAGWYPSVWYSDDKIESLWTLGDRFAVEVINGANKVVRAYDEFDAKAIGIWDRLLCDGRQVTALGGSDAHGPDEIGSVWTGVLGAVRSASSIIKALNAGRCFASEASLMSFTANGAPMGATVTAAKGSKVELGYRVADSAGIASVRVISQGKVIKEIRAGGETVVDGRLTRKAGAQATFYRLESTAADDRRAFSTPIYVAPTS